VKKVQVSEIKFEKIEEKNVSRIVLTVVLNKFADITFFKKIERTT